VSSRRDNVGRGIAAVAADVTVAWNQPVGHLRRTPPAEYGFTDIDGHSRTVGERITAVQHR